MATPWKLPFNLALLCHVLVLAAAIILPKYLPKKPVIPEFLTVDLVNIATPIVPTVNAVPPQTSPVELKTKVNIQKIQPVQARKTAPITPVAAVPLPVAPTKAISLKPLKHKVKKKPPIDNTAKSTQRQRETQRKIEQQALAKERQRLLQEARLQKSLADAEEAAANDAVKALRQMLRADSQAITTAQTIQSATRPGGNSGNIIEKQYQASIGSNLMAHWALPEIKVWDPDISAQVVIEIAKNGQIISHRFEKHSGDRVFDQFVSRTIQDSDPLPPIPAAMRISQYSIGLRFRPGQIQ